MRILLVEDDKIIGDGIVQGLSLDNYAVDWVEDKESALTALSTLHYEMVLLDIGLPDGSGLDILTHLRAKNNDVPIMIITAFNKTQLKIEGLDGGADDYLTKPFDLDELSARVRALRRRSTGRASPLLRVNNINLDPAKKVVTRDGIAVSLGPKEFAILQLLMESAGRVLSKTQIEDSLYGWNMEIESNTIEVHIHGIRKKLGKDSIQTIRHVGYTIEDSTK
ncbi:MAG: DNA-binding response OmpR family regulator [Gammaproteobacteria bacterium]|jgi:DNA-binding response OmpR family regulator